MASRSTVRPETSAQELIRLASQEGHYPVDLAAIAAFLGITIIEDRLESDLSGMLIRDDENRAVIVVNKSDLRVRKRFTIAHELGHHRLHAGRPLLLEPNSPKFRLNERRTGGEVPSPHEEHQANQFAAELLMPQYLVENAFDRLSITTKDESQLIASLATEFEVSTLAMRYRLANLGIVVPA